MYGGIAGPEGSNTPGAISVVRHEASRSESRLGVGFPKWTLGTKLVIPLPYPSPLFLLSLLIFVRDSVLVVHAQALRQILKLIFIA
jgi:hypothetical protein